VRLLHLRMIMTASSILQTNPKPDGPAVHQALAGNFCRCGTHVRNLNAVARPVAATVGTGDGRSA
jgi:nicotinate dehydrogenase subunit A